MAMMAFLIASFATIDILEIKFLISLSIISALSLIRQISNNNKISVKNGD